MEWTMVHKYWYSPGWVDPAAIRQGQCWVGSLEFLSGKAGGLEIIMAVLVLGPDQSVLCKP